MEVLSLLREGCWMDDDAMVVLQTAEKARHFAHKM